MTDWYSKLRTIKSLGSASKRPGSLAKLHEARNFHKGQFYTPETMIQFLWNILKPSMEMAAIKFKGKIALFDNSVGSGRLFSCADPQKYTLTGVDIHQENINDLIEVSTEAGFESDFVCTSMEKIQVQGKYNVGLINPPFSLHFESPLLEKYDCCSFGKFGPQTSAISHAYSLYQALENCQIVAAILPSTYAQTVINEGIGKKRLRAVIKTPTNSFIEEKTTVNTTILIFDSIESQCETYDVKSFSDQIPQIELTCQTDTVRRPRLVIKGIIDDKPTITNPVTGDKKVKISHDSRRIVLSFNCGLTEARVKNVILGENVKFYSETNHRYPKEIKFTGQGILDIECHLMQDDPRYSFNLLVKKIKQAGGEPEVTPTIQRYLTKRIRQIQRQIIPFSHTIYSPNGIALKDGTISGLAKDTFISNPDLWGSPIIKTGTQLEFTTVNKDNEPFYRSSIEGIEFDISPEEFYSKFESVSADSKGSWIVKFPGKSFHFKEIAQHYAKKIKDTGIINWLNWEFQYQDLCELMISPTGAVASWDMGLGKARLSLALCLLNEGKHNLLCLKPHLIQEMIIELASLPIDKDCWQVIERPEQLSRLKKINIISYNRLRSPLATGHKRRTYAKMLRRRINTAVFDEGHLLRNGQSQQSRAAWQISAKKRFVLTGTVISNYPKDILPLISFTGGDGTAAQPFGLNRGFLEKHHIKSTAWAKRGIQEFSDRFVCFEWVSNEFAEKLETGAKRMIPKINNVEQFRSMIAPHILRRVDQEPLVQNNIQIPLPQIIDTYLDFDPDHLSYYLKVADEFKQWYLKAKGQANDTSKQMNLIALLARIQAVFFAANYPQRGYQNFTAYTKLTSKHRYAIDRLIELSGQGHKTILYASSPDCLNMIHRELDQRGISSVLFHGKIPIKQRSKDLDDNFRFSDNSKILLASLNCGSTGLNIPQASRILLINRSWSSTEEKQAMKRVLRPQQKKDVVVENIMLKGSLDEYQQQMVSFKEDSALAGVDWCTPKLNDVEFLHLDTILGKFVSDLAEKWGCKGYEVRDQLKIAA